MPINLYFFHIYFYLHKCKQLLSKLGDRPGTWLSLRKICSKGWKSQMPLWKSRSPKSGNGPLPTISFSQTINIGVCFLCTYSNCMFKRDIQIPISFPVLIRKFSLASLEKLWFPHTLVFLFLPHPVPPWSEWDPNVSLWSGHRVSVWISCQASVHEHQVGQECPSFLHTIFARPGMTKREMRSWGKGVGKIACKTGSYLDKSPRPGICPQSSEKTIFTGFLLWVQNI